MVQKRCTATAPVERLPQPLQRRAPMGYSTEYVDSGQENHLAEFTCAVCCNLVDAPLLTTCHHVFCTSCLQDWMDRMSKCPTCATVLDPRHGAGPLQQGSPLAW